MPVWHNDVLAYLVANQFSSKVLFFKFRIVSEVHKMENDTEIVDTFSPAHFSVNLL